MSKLNDILIKLSAANGEEYHKLHSGKQEWDLTDGRMKYNEARAEQQIKDLIKELIAKSKHQTYVKNVPGTYIDQDELDELVEAL